MYEYVVKDYAYGENNVHICAYDDGGRHACTSASFKVKSESEIKITMLDKTVLPPNSTIFIETTSKVTLGINAKVKLPGLNGENSYDDNSPLMLQTSRVGNTISHRFPWRQSKEGRYYIRTVLYENGENTDTEDATEVIIAEPRVIKIFSLSNGQEFEEYKPIRIAVDAMDVKGNIVQDQLELIIDGKYKRTVYNARRTESSPTNKQVIDKEYFSTVSDLEKGVHTVQILARSGHYHRDGQILGKSEIINIIVK